MASTDPDFETNAADIIDLYLDPPATRRCSASDEETAIQALDGRDGALPLLPGRAPRTQVQDHAWPPRMIEEAEGPNHAP